MFATAALQVMVALAGALPASAATPPAPATTSPTTRLLSLPSHAIANGTRPLKVTLSGPPAPDSPPPTLHPAVAGAWSAVGDAEVFTPASTLEPCSSYTLTVWARTHIAGGSELGRRHTIHLNVACPPVAGVQQALARLGYLGAKFHPRYTVHIPSGRETRGEAAALAFHPWASLLSAETANRHSPTPYTWVSVSESLPETLHVHRGHHVVFSTPVNTGVPGATTERGIFPIYSRLTSTTMSGTDVDGTKYVVPNVPWVNYFNRGDAVHGYPRSSYGFPQSNGCVELPIGAAHTVFGMLALGDIVEVGG